jgi:hypothetical protein
MDREYYFQQLYPLQDRLLQAFGGKDTGFYLGGGTAASRGYLQHRFSDDLDLFVNDEPRFGLWADRLIDSVRGMPEITVNVLLREDRFVRFEAGQVDVLLKVELVNDVPAHVGQVKVDPVLGRIDSAENILANKITALIDREEPKDMADVWGFACKLELSIADAITGAQSKAAGVFPADIARVLLNATREDWSLVRWIDAPPAEDFVAELHALGEKLLLLRS